MKFHDKPGPIYGQQMLPESLPLSGTLMQACPSADELAQQSMRTAEDIREIALDALGRIGE